MGYRKSTVPVGITKCDESELSSGIDNEIFSHSTNMAHRHRGPHQEFHNEVSVRDPPHAVLSDRSKT